MEQNQIVSSLGVIWKMRTLCSESVLSCLLRWKNEGFETQVICESPGLFPKICPTGLKFSNLKLEKPYYLLSGNYSLPSSISFVSTLFSSIKYKLDEGETVGLYFKRNNKKLIFTDHKNIFSFENGAAFVKKENLIDFESIKPKWIISCPFDLMRKRLVSLLKKRHQTYIKNYKKLQLKDLKIEEYLKNPSILEI